MYNSSTGIWFYPEYAPDGQNTSFTELEQFAGNTYRLRQVGAYWGGISDSDGKFYPTLELPVTPYGSSNKNWDYVYNRGATTWLTIGGSCRQSVSGGAWQLITGNTLSTPSSLTVTFINDLLSYLSTRPFDVVDIDFEGFWDTPLDGSFFVIYSYFLKHLGNALHNNGILLNVDAHATDHSYPRFEYSVLNFNDIDYLTMMTYDQYWEDLSANTGLAPLSWLTAVYNKLQTDIGSVNMKRVIFGIPSYGYDKLDSDTSTGYSVRGTASRITTSYPNSATATRESLTGEMKFSFNDGGARTARYCDSTTLDIKRLHLESLGVKNTHVWSANGNPWFPQAEPSSSLYRANLNGTVTVSNTAPSLGDSVVFTFTVNNTNDSAIANKGEITWYPSRSLTNLEYSLDGVTFLPYSTSIKNQLLYNNGSKVYRFRGTYSNNNKKPTYRFLARYGNTPEIVDLSITHQ